MSAIMPKSMAPMDNRFAESPLAAITARVIAREIGITRAVMIAARKFPRNRNRAIPTRRIPLVAVSITFTMTVFISSHRS